MPGAAHPGISLSRKFGFDECVGSRLFCHVKENVKSNRKTDAKELNPIGRYRFASLAKMTTAVGTTCSTGVYIVIEKLYQGQAVSLRSNAINQN